MKDGFSHLVNTRTGGPRCDITPVFGNAAAFRSLVRAMRQKTQGVWFDRVAGLDALGFVMASAFALDRRKGFVPIRKAGKLPVPVRRIGFRDYSRTVKKLEVGQGAFRRGERVLLVDDWIETGAQMKAAARLVEQSGAKVAAMLCLHADQNRRTEWLYRKYKILSLTGSDFG